MATLTYFKYRLPVRLGALIMIFALALDPFSQQLLQFRQGLVAADEITPFARAKRSERYTGGSIERRRLPSENDSSEPMYSAMVKLEGSMEAAIKDGLYRPPNQFEQQTTTICPADACTWPRFQTLGVCQKCNDLTSELTEVANFGEAYGAIYGFLNDGEYDDETGTAFALPNGHFLANINRCSIGSNEQCSMRNSSGGSVLSYAVTTTTFGTGNPSMTNSMKDVDTLIWSMSFIDVDLEQTQWDSPRWPDVPVRATECALYYCVKSIDVKVESNSLQENATEETDAKRDPSSWNATEIGSYAAIHEMPPQSELESLEFNKYSTDFPRTDLKLYYPNNRIMPNYTIDDSTVWSVSAFFQGLLSDNITASPSIRAAISKALPNKPVGLNGHVLGSDRKFPPDLDAFQNSDIPTIFRSLARRMTDQMRLNAVDNFRRRDVVDGNKMVRRDSYKVEWGWIALHGALLLGGIILWCLTVWHSLRPSQQIPAWKNSSLAVINSGFRALGILIEADSVKEMKKSARKRMVKIPVDEHPTISQTALDGGLLEIQREGSRGPPPYSAD